MMILLSLNLIIALRLIINMKNNYLNECKSQLNHAVEYLSEIKLSIRQEIIRSRSKSSIKIFEDQLKTIRLIEVRIENAINRVNRKMADN
jgi:hypothetical protein